MNSRILPMLNLLGCLALTGLVVMQWRRERSLDGRLVNLKSQLEAANHQANEESKHRAALERDITVLKESIEATQKAAETAARELEEKEQLVTQLQAANTAAHEQLTSWEDAVKQRDERIREIEAQLAKTRAKLDDAVSRLKEAAAR
jgi:chromosome segregation ATPase